MTISEWKVANNKALNMANDYNNLAAVWQNLGTKELSFAVYSRGNCIYTQSQGWELIAVYDRIGSMLHRWHNNDCPNLARR